MKTNVNQAAPRRKGRGKKGALSAPRRTRQQDTPASGRDRVAGHVRETTLAGRSYPAAYGQLVIQAYLNGLFVVLAFEDALANWLNVDFAWITPTDRYRFYWGDQAGGGHVLPVTESSGRDFGFRLLTQTEPYSLSQLKRTEPRLEYSNGNVLSARAARWNRLVPRALRGEESLVEFYPVVDTYGHTDPAYRVVPGRTTLAIVGVEPDGGAGAPNGLWNTFSPPPGECAETRTPARFSNT